MKTHALLALLLLTACDNAAPPPEQKTEQQAVAPQPAAPQAAAGLRMDGLDGARVGMTLSELQTALGPVEAPSGADPNACLVAKVEKYPGVFIMMTGGVLQRIEVREGALATDTGLRIGDAAEKVQETYGARVETLPHKYEWESGAQYLTVYDEAKTHAIRFVTSGGKIATFHAGNAEQVQYVESCG